MSIEKQLLMWIFKTISVFALALFLLFLALNNYDKNLAQDEAKFRLGFLNYAPYIENSDILFRKLVRKGYLNQDDFSSNTYGYACMYSYDDNFMSDNTGCGEFRGDALVLVNIEKKGSTRANFLMLDLGISIKTLRFADLAKWTAVGVLQRGKIFN